MTDALKRLIERRRKLLELHYDGKMSSELFGEEETKLTQRIVTLREEQATDAGEIIERNELLERFESVLQCSPISTSTRSGRTPRTRNVECWSTSSSSASRCTRTIWRSSCTEYRG